MPSTPTPTCRVIHSGEATHTGKQGFSYFTGVSSETAGARAICMHLLTIPPGGRAKAHLHDKHETAIYVLSGEGKMWYGDGLREKLVFRGGDFLYVPPGVPHLPVNLSPTQPCIALIARSDPNEQESVVVLPELDSVVDAELRAAAPAAPARAPTRVSR
jgi:uncharacterized RmlC-like cupin family protein